MKQLQAIPLNKECVCKGNFGVIQKWDGNLRCQNCLGKVNK